jgi:hypothetical protein
MKDIAERAPVEVAVAEEKDVSGEVPPAFATKVDKRDVVIAVKRVVEGRQIHQADDENDGRKTNLRKQVR